MANKTKRPHVPQKLRRLTREEASRLGVSYSAKRRIRASIKHPTSRTRLYTDREVAQSKLHKTKETFTRERRHASVSKKTGKLISTYYEDIPKSEFFKLLKKYSNHFVIVVFKAESTLRGSRYDEENGPVWITGTSKILASDVIAHYDDQLRRLKITSPPKRFALRVYPLD